MTTFKTLLFAAVISLVGLPHAWAIEYCPLGSQKRMPFTTLMFKTIELPGTSDDVVSRVNDFFSKNGKPYGINDPATDLLLVEAKDLSTGEDASPLSQKPDADIDVKFRRLIGGLPLFNVSVRVSVTSDAEKGVQIDSIMQKVPSDLAKFLKGKTLQKPKVSETRAKEIAVYGTEAAGASLELIAFNWSVVNRCPDETRPAYYVTLSKPGYDDPNRVIVDAINGDVLMKFSGRRQH